MKYTFCSSWDPEYFADIDLISPPNAEAQSFTLRKERQKRHGNLARGSPHKRTINSIKKETFGVF